MLPRTRRASQDTSLWWLFALSLLPLSLATSLSMAQNPKISAAAFDRKAFEALPEEASYTFYKELTEGADPELGQRDPAAKLGSDEMALAGEGWILRIQSGAGSPLREADPSSKSPAKGQ